MASKTVTLSLLEPAVEVGKALRIRVLDPIKDVATTQYIPLSCIWEIHPDSVVVDEWIVIKKGLV